MANPECGDLIRGSGGLRKLRWAGSGRGKRGGLRVIYYCQVPGSVIRLLLAYPKNQQKNLTPAQLKILKSIIEMGSGLGKTYTAAHQDLWKRGWHGGIHSHGQWSAGFSRRG